jgi:ribosomal protein S30
VAVIAGQLGVEKQTNRNEAKERHDTSSLREDKDRAKELPQVRRTLKHQIKIKSNFICLFCLF